MVLSWPVISVVTSTVCLSLVLRYEKSAVHYAETQSSFEEIALKFLQVWQIEALKTFLKKVSGSDEWSLEFNPLNPELNPICYLLALLAHHFLHVSRVRVKSLTLRLLMSYI